MRYTVKRSIPPVDRLWPDETVGPWQLLIDIEMIDGRPQPISISLQPLDAATPAPLTTLALRKLRLMESVHLHLEAQRQALGDNLESLTDAMADDLDLANEVPRSMLDEWSGKLDDLGHARRRPGRPVEVKDNDYRHIANLYRGARATGLPIIATIAEQLFISQATAAKRIRTARQLGYLPPTSRGKARSVPEETS